MTCVKKNVLIQTIVAAKMASKSKPKCCLVVNHIRR